MHANTARHASSLASRSPSETLASSSLIATVGWDRMRFSPFCLLSFSDGRAISEAHYKACLYAGLQISGEYILFGFNLRCILSHAMPTAVIWHPQLQHAQGRTP